MAALALALFYALLLFAFAAWADQMGNEAIKARLRRPSYALALAVYCTSWTYYGAVGSAVADGWSYLPIYLGPILVFVFGFGFLTRLVEAVKADGANSISEFIGGRFGNSRGVAALVTTLALLGSIPYIALQLRALGTTYALLSGTAVSSTSMAVAAIGLALFAMMYGTRRYEAASRNNSVLFSVGIESLVKLLALIIAGWVAVAVLQRADSAEAAQALSRLSRNFAPSDIGADLFIITLLSMSAIICLPRQFYVTVIQAQSTEDLRKARWPFVAYLLATTLVVLPIAAAGMMLLPGDVRPDLFVLQLPLSQGLTSVALLVFLGGFSAVTAMVVVESIALATMISNDLVAPVLLRGDHLRGEGAMGKAQLLVRRLAIAAIMLAALGWALGIGENERLASIGLVAFAAMAQFAPVLILAVLGPDRDALAAKAGLSAGLLMWAYTLALPQVMPSAWLANLDGTLLDPSKLFGIGGLSPISHGTIWSIGANLALFVIVTMRRVRPGALPALLRAPQQTATRAATVGELKQLVTRFIGPESAAKGFASFHENALVDRNSTRTAERLIAGVVGLPSARAYLSSALYGTNLNHAEIARLLDDTGQSLRFSKGLLAATLENIDPGVSVVDRDLNIVAWNRRYLDLFDYPAGMVYVGAPVADLIRYNAERGECGPGEVDAHVERRLGHMRRGQPHSFERIRPDGRVLKTVGGPMPSGGYVMCFTDVTAEARALAEVERAKAELETRVNERTSDLHAANLALANTGAEKTRFLAAASHDLLQPLHAARLFSAAIRRGSADHQVALLQKLDKSIEAAETLLRALLDVSKLDAGGVTPKIEALRVRPLLVELAETMSPLAREKGLNLRVGAGDATVETDPGLLRSIVQNYLSNAIRYTNEGGILVGVRRRGTEARIDVIDTGPGIPEDKLTQIFREFERLPNSAEGGIGLGLAIVERTARLLDARISVQSHEQRGSRFSVSLPRSQRTAAPVNPARPAKPLTPAALSILLLDDDPRNCEALASYLMPFGHTVTAYHDVQTALAVTDRLDLALIDFDLGGVLDGLNVAEQLLARGRVGRIALVTAAKPEDYETRAAAMGIRVFRKPIQTEALDQWIAGAAS